MLALAIGSVSPLPQAQAAPERDLVAYSVSAEKARSRPICTGQPLTITVTIQAHVQSEGAPEAKKDILVQRRVYATVEGVGKIEPTISRATATGNNPSRATFTFKSDKPGKAVVTFEVDVLRELLPGKPGFAPTRPPQGTDVYLLKTNPVEVTVVRCKFRVRTLGDWVVPGEANINIAAISNDAEVKADEQGNFTGSTSVNWTASVSRVMDCGGAITIGSSQLNWTGTLDDSGQLTLNGSYLSAAASLDAVCAGGGESTTGSEQFDLTPDPVQVSVASSGGTLNQSQVLEGPEAMSGSVTIIVIPEEDQAVAFNPEAGSSSIHWITALWESFPWMSLSQ
jgi:hypothetical protein